jgi:hypothetical protein
LVEFVNCVVTLPLSNFLLELPLAGCLVMTMSMPFYLPQIYHPTILPTYYSTYSPSPKPPTLSFPEPLNNPGDLLEMHNFPLSSPTWTHLFTVSHSWYFPTLWQWMFYYLQLLLVCSFLPSQQILC